MRNFSVKGRKIKSGHRPQPISFVEPFDRIDNVLIVLNHPEGFHVRKKEKLSIVRLNLTIKKSKYFRDGFRKWFN